jgi:putative transposase
MVIEDLHVAGMLRQHAIAGSIAEQSFGELRRQLTYKSTWYANQLVVADRWYGSSKTCSACGHYHQHLRRGAQFACPGCGVVLDRDHNAAVNLARLACTPASSRSG